MTVAIAEAVILRHGSFADPAHKVDGVLPTADAASVAGPTVTVTWSEALDAASVPAGAGGFTVRIVNANDPAVTAVAVSGSTTVLSLASAIPDGTPNVTLEYDPPSGAKIRDAAGNDAAAILRADALEVTVTPDTRAPVLKSIVVDGATLTMTYDEALKVTSPVTSGGDQVYNVGTAGSNFTVLSARSGVGADNTQVTMTLDPPAEAGQMIGVSYHGAERNNGEQGTGPCRQCRRRVPRQRLARAGAEHHARGGERGLRGHGAGLRDRRQGRRSISPSPRRLRVTATSSARPELSLTVGVNTRKARYVSGTGSATLRFEYVIVAGDEDNDGVAIPADALSTPFGSSIVTVAGSRTVQFGHDAVAADPARTVDGVRPKATTASVAGPTVTVTWSEALDAGRRADGRGRVHGCASPLPTTRR